MTFLLSLPSGAHPISELHRQHDEQRSTSPPATPVLDGSSPDEICAIVGTSHPLHNINHDHLKETVELCSHPPDSSLDGHHRVTSCETIRGICFHPDSETGSLLLSGIRFDWSMLSVFKNYGNYELLEPLFAGLSRLLELNPKTISAIRPSDLYESLRHFFYFPHTSDGPHTIPAKMFHCNNDTQLVHLECLLLEVVTQFFLFGYLTAEDFPVAFLLDRRLGEFLESAHLEHRIVGYRLLSAICEQNLADALVPSLRNPPYLKRISAGLEYPEKDVRVPALELLAQLSVIDGWKSLISCCIVQDRAFVGYAPQGAQEITLYWGIWEQVIYGIVDCKTKVLRAVVARARNALIERTQDLLNSIGEIKDEDQFQVRAAVVRIVVALLTMPGEDVMNQLVWIFGSIEEMARRIVEVFQTEYSERVVSFAGALLKILEFPGQTPESRRKVIELLGEQEFVDDLEKEKETYQEVDGGEKVFKRLQEIIQPERESG